MAYAGEMEFARAQFASDAPQLQLVAMADAIASAARPEGRAIDVAFLDSGAPSVNAAALVMELRRVMPSLPIVLALDPGRDDAAKIAWQLGVDDYTVKSPGWLARLTVRLSLALARHERAARGDRLKAQEDRLRSIVETTPACLARVARDGTVLAVNAAARALFGATTNREVLKKPFVTFVAADDREKAGRFIEQASDGAAATVELSIARMSGESQRIEVRAVQLPARGDIAATALLTLDARTETNAAEAPVHVAAPPAQASREPELERRIGELEEAQRRLEAERDAERQALKASAAQAQANAVAAQTEARAAQADALAARAETVAAQTEARAAHAQALAAQTQARAAEAEVQAAHAEIQAAQTQARTAHADAQAAQAELRALGERLQTVDQSRHTADAERAALVQELDSRRAAADEHRQLAAAHQELQRRLEEMRQRQVADHTESQSRIAALDAECARLTLERNHLAADADTARSAQRALEDLVTQLQAQTATLQAQTATSADASAERDELRRAHETATAERDALRQSSATFAAERDDLQRALAALMAERDELRRAVETTTARHATEVALAFADKASIERRLHEMEAQLQRQRDDDRAAHSRVLEEEAETRRQLEAEVELLTCERDAVLRALSQSQEYEAHARRWMTQWLELEQAMQRTRREIARLVEWPQEGLAARDAAAAGQGTSAESPWQ